MNYWILKTPIQDDGAHLSTLPTAGPEDFLYSKGESLKAQHPQDSESVMCFDTDFPDRIKLFDFVSNLDEVLIGNKRVRDVFEQLGIENVEYLPVWLMNHQGEIASKDYTILNVLGSVDAIDMEKSKYRMGRIIKTQINRVKHLVLDNDNIPEEAQVFRASSKLNEIFISDPLKQALEAAGLSGWKAIEAQGWDGMDF
ncbi:imm11 family protein [Agarilytica rhodophyticola]|uniref:imm11 family protein n=1 Tax=Agarilytica rhodophyticola TaxID=1737490 RepID=UPI000B343801|nr:DUF1629 domain-containing protein [Agarilytica rhodophyticola]